MRLQLHLEVRGMNFSPVVATRGRAPFYVPKGGTLLRSLRHCILAVFCGGLIAAALAGPAAAGPFEREMAFRLFVQDRRPWPEPQRDAARLPPQRDWSAPQRDWPTPQRDWRAPGDADRGRMSPDERRQLRRDIQDAGRDIYQRERQAPRREYERQAPRREQRR
jgi:hypothetical protein